MKCAVARYYDHDGPRSPYSIAFYTSLREAEDAPHDYCTRAGDVGWWGRSVVSKRRGTS